MHNPYWFYQGPGSTHKFITSYSSPRRLRFSKAIKFLCPLRTVTFSFSTLDCLLLMRFTFVRPAHQYACVVWNSLMSYSKTFLLFIYIVPSRALLFYVNVLIWTALPSQQVNKHKWNVMIFNPTWLPSQLNLNLFCQLFEILYSVLLCVCMFVYLSKFYLWFVLVL